VWHFHSEFSIQPASLEDATIVDANFDLVAFMAEQEAKEEDLPDLPGSGPSPLDSVTLDVLSQSADASFSEISQPAIALSALGALQGLPRYALDVLLEAATLQAYPDGAMVVSEGAPLGACRIIQSGRLRLLKRDPASEGSTLARCATVGAGALIGASAFMSQVAGGEKMALGAAVADGPLSVVEVPVHAIDGLRDRFPAARSTFELFYRERCSDLLMSTSSLFASLAEHDRAELVGMFEPVRAAAGQDVIERGGNIGGFFLVLSGQVEVLRDNGHAFVLQPGGYVGDVGVLQGQPSAATVRASQSTELGRLDAHRFYDLIAKHPEVWGEVWRESSRDELAELHLVLGTAATL
jgi:CRP-like cAMP-binding protein